MILQDFELIVKPFSNILSICALSENYKIVEQSFLIWSNVKIVPLLLDKARIIYPILLPNLILSAKNHWNLDIQTGSFSVMKSMHSIDPFIFDEISKKNNRDNNKKKEKIILIHKGWANIARFAAKKDKELNLARILTELQFKFGDGKSLDDNNIQRNTNLYSKNFLK